MKPEVFLDPAYAKESGMTDCLSFVIMQDRGIIEALTTDEHFQQAGFRALWREMTSSA